MLEKERSVILLIEALSLLAMKLNGRRTSRSITAQYNTVTSLLQIPEFSDVSSYKLSFRIIVIV